MDAGWMRVCVGLARGGCRGKAPCRGVFGGVMTLNVFVIFWRFESQGVCNLSKKSTGSLINDMLPIW